MTEIIKENIVTLSKHIDSMTGNPLFYTIGHRKYSGLEPTDFILPEGYTLEKTSGSDWHIFTPWGECVSSWQIPVAKFCPADQPLPKLVTTRGCPILRPVENNHDSR